jgi:hypothetical protein
VPFTDRFQLLGLKRDEGACSFEAREIANGRPVLVHLFADRTSPLNRALLAKVDALPSSERGRIIDRGEHEGGVYIVTDRLAEYPGLHEWLRAKHPDRARPLDEGGAWRMNSGTKQTVDDQLATLFETAPTPVVEPSPLDEPKPPVLTDTGEMTLLLPAPPPRPSTKHGDVAPLAAPPVLRPAPPAVPKVERTPAAPPNESGEFTRRFAPPEMRPGSPTAAATPKIEPLPPVAPAAPRVEPPAVPTSPASQPSEFTRQFAPPVLRPPAPAAPRVEPPPSTPTPPPNEPGEFTRQFAPPVLRSAAPTVPPVDPPPAAPTPPSNEPGEFTRQFAPPVLRPAPRIEPTPVAATPPASPPGEFTLQFAAPPLAPQSPPKPAPGEFTKQFELPQRPVSAPRPAPTTRSGEQQTPGQQPSRQEPSGQQPGEFTQMLRAQHPAAPVSPPTPSAGEFTKFFDSPMAPPPLGSPQQIAPMAPPPTPPKGAGEFTQVFGRDSMPSAPPPPAPAAPPPSSSGNATQVFNMQRPTPPTSLVIPAPNAAPQGPGEYTRMFAKPAPLTFGQAPAVPQAPHLPEPAPIARNSSRLPMLLLLIGAAVLLIAAAVVYYVMRPHSP